MLIIIIILGLKLNFYDPKKLLFSQNDDSNRTDVLNVTAVKISGGLVRVMSKI